MIRLVSGTTQRGNTRSLLVDVPATYGSTAEHVASGYAEHVLGWIEVSVEKPEPGVQSHPVHSIMGESALRALLAVWESAPTQ